MPSSRAAKRNRIRLRRRVRRGDLKAYTPSEPPRKRYKLTEWLRSKPVDIESEDA